MEVGSCNTIPSWCWKIGIPEIIAIQGDCFCDMLESYHEADMHLYGRKDGFIPMVEDFIVYHGDIGPSDRVETSAPIMVSDGQTFLSKCPWSKCISFDKCIFKFISLIVISLDATSERSNKLFLVLVSALGRRWW